MPIVLTNDLNRLHDDSRLGAGDRIAEIEELVSKALHLNSRLFRQHERWAEPIRAGTAPFQMEEAKVWQVSFQQWADDARHIIKAARAIEERGFQVDQLEQLRTALRQCEYDGMDVERLVKAAEAHKAGLGIPGTEIRDAIQRRL